MQTLSASALYFSLVFGAGFILGFIRMLWLAPRVGESTAELLEMPVMLFVIILAARWVVRRSHILATLANSLCVGMIALSFLLAAEFGGVLWLRGMSIGDYFASRDPVTVAVYGVMLGVLAVMPLIVARH